MASCDTRYWLLHWGLRDGPRVIETTDVKPPFVGRRGDFEVIDRHVEPDPRPATR